MKSVSKVVFVTSVFLGSGLAYAQDHSAPPRAHTAADNTRVNARDKAHDTTTPTDQPNNKADIDVAANVRRAIVKDKSLSMSAHNLKLVASGGTVVLRGPVASAGEKAKVEKIVSAVAGVTHVDNQLDIAP